MQITFVTDVGESYSLEIDPNMEMENIMALLEAEVCFPCDAVLVYWILYENLVQYTCCRTEYFI